MQSAPDHNKGPSLQCQPSRQPVGHANGSQQLVQPKPTTGSCENKPADSSNNNSLQGGTPSALASTATSTTSLKLVKDLNQFITCNLCKGYLIDATTIIECLHSYCRACIVKYMDQDNAQSRLCPKCNGQIHKTKPKQNIRSDPTLQDIVYKLVPKLYKNEMSRRRAFYSKHPDKAIGLSSEEKGEIHAERMILSPDDNIQLTIEYFPEVSSPFKLLPFKNDENQKLPGNMNQRRYLLCKAGMRVLHLVKFIRYKYDLDAKIQVDFFYKQELLRDDLTIMDLAYIYTWGRNMPIPLYYLIIEPDKDKSDYLCLFSQSKMGVSKPAKMQKRRRVLKNILEPSNCNSQVNGNRPPLPPTIRSGSTKKKPHHVVSSSQRLFGSPSKSPAVNVISSRKLNVAGVPGSAAIAKEAHTANKNKLSSVLKRRIHDSGNGSGSSAELSEAKKVKTASKENLQSDSKSNSAANSLADCEITFTEDDSSTDISETSFQIDIICKSDSNASCSDAASSTGAAGTNAGLSKSEARQSQPTTTTTTGEPSGSAKPSTVDRDKQLTELDSSTTTTTLLTEKTDHNINSDTGKPKWDGSVGGGDGKQGNPQSSFSNAATSKTEEIKARATTAEESANSVADSTQLSKHVQNRSPVNKTGSGKPPEVNESDSHTKQECDGNLVDSSTTDNATASQLDVPTLPTSKCPVASAKGENVCVEVPPSLPSSSPPLPPVNTSLNGTTASGQTKPTANGHGSLANGSTGDTTSAAPVTSSSSTTTFAGSFLLGSFSEPLECFHKSLPTFPSTFHPSHTSAQPNGSLNRDGQLGSSTKPINLK